MQVNQEDYEDKLTQINRLNREVVCLKKKVESLTDQRDLLLDCITGMCENPSPENAEAIRHKVAELRKMLGQSEML